MNILHQEMFLLKQNDHQFLEQVRPNSVSAVVPLVLSIRLIISYWSFGLKSSHWTAQTSQPNLKKFDHQTCWKIQLEIDWSTFENNENVPVW